MKRSFFATGGRLKLRLTRHLALFLLFVFFACKGSIASAQTWVSHGPDVIAIGSLATDLRHPDTVYAGTDGGGVFKSTNRGEHWKASNGGDLKSTSTITAIEVAPSDSQIVYAVSKESGLLKSVDGGSAWKLILKNVAPGHLVVGVAVDPTNAAIVYSGFSDEGNAYKSVDGGATWGAAGIASGNNIATPTAFAVDPESPETVYAGSIRALYKSLNGGLSFTAVLATGPFTVIAIDPRAPATVYAGTDGAGVIRSTDRGLHWTDVNSGLTNRHVSTLVVDPVNSGTVYAGTPDGIFKSRDAGTNWSAANSGLDGSMVSALAIDSTSLTIYAGTPFAGVFSSRDGASHWHASNHGLPISPVPIVGALAIDPRVPTTAYAGTSGGLFKSTNEGDRWQLTGLANTNVGAVAVGRSAPTTLYATAGTSQILMKSVDGGANWSLTGLTDSNGFKNVTVITAAVDPKTTTTVYAATESRFNAGLNKSTDGGATWHLTGLSNGVFPALAMDPKIPTTVYAAGYSNIVIGGRHHGVFKSTDGGVTWSAVCTGLPTAFNGFETPERALVIDPKRPATLYVVVAPFGIFQTTDGGANWVAVNTGLPVAQGAQGPRVSALAIDPNTPSTLYTGTGGVFRTTDGGAHWSAFGNGMPASIGVSALVVAPTARSTPYAGTVGKGVFVLQQGKHKDDDGSDTDGGDE